MSQVDIEGLEDLVLESWSLVYNSVLKKLVLVSVKKLHQWIEELDNKSEGKQAKRKLLCPFI